MGGISNLLNLGREAIQAQSYALNVTGQNVSNVNTSGYVRRTADLATQGNGTQTQGGVYARGLSRAADQYVDARNYEASGFDSSAKTRDGALGTVENLFNDTSGTGLSTSLNALFSSFSSLASAPTDTTARNTVIESARDLAQRIQDTSGQILTQREDLLSQAQSTAKEINGYTSQIAKLNQQIAVATNTGADGADLKDQRDSVALELSKRINVHVTTDGSGNMLVASGGSTLVEGNHSTDVTIGAASDGSIQVLASRGSEAAIDITQQVTSGTLGGIREARDTDLAAISSKLDQFATDLAAGVNTQHAAGVGSDGTGGHNLFQISDTSQAAATLSLDSSIDGHPEWVAAASSTSELPAGSSNAVLLSKLSDEEMATSSTRTATQAYSDIVGDVGQRKSNSAQDVTLRDSMLSQTKTLRDSTSGVSLDDEMASISQYQRAYQAASKLITTSDELLADLMQKL